MEVCECECDILVDDVQFIDVRFCVCMRCGCVSTDADADDGGGGSGSGCDCGGAEIAVVGIGFEDEETVISVCPVIKKDGSVVAEVPAFSRREDDGEDGIQGIERSHVRGKKRRESEKAKIMLNFKFK